MNEYEFETEEATKPMPEPTEEERAWSAIVIGRAPTREAVAS